MNVEQQPMQIDARTQNALDELQGLIRGKYPQASFVVVHGEDPEGIYLKATVDVPDLDEVVDVFIDRLVELQVDEGLPVYVVPLEPMERVIETLRTRGLPRRYQVLGEAAANP